jgi:hypothetical protein
VLAMSIIEAALRLYTDMATFASAGVSGADAMCMRDKSIPQGARI